MKSITLFVAIITFGIVQAASADPISKVFIGTGSDGKPCKLSIAFTADTLQQRESTFK